MGRFLLILTLLPILCAQPSFEAASVKPSTVAHLGWSISPTATQVTYRNISLFDWIQLAFGVEKYSLSGPSWLDSQRFDVVAKLPAGGLPRDNSRRMQSLLVERFKLVSHYSEKPVEGFALVEAKGGRKDQHPENPKGGKSGSGSGYVWGNEMTIADLAQMLSRQLNRPIQDATGITAPIDFSLRWMPDPQPGTPDPPDPGPSIFTAIQEQLGLKLERRSVPVKVLVIDSLEKLPVEN
jgi:uncharacterized protein (TIGR03435 family)